MTGFFIYLVLLVPSHVDGRPVEVQVGVVRAAFSSPSACDTHGRKLAAQTQLTVPAKYKATHRCEAIVPTPQPGALL